jgi:hypothetical protein
VGQVYVANPSSTKVFYTVNGGPIPTGWPARAGGPPYIVSAALVKYPAAGSFNLGSNSLTAQFSDQTGGFVFPLSITGVSVDADLVLYVFRGYAVLMSQFGYVISTAGAPLPPPLDPEPTSAA